MDLKYITQHIKNPLFKRKIVALGITHISVFGSFARDEALPESDLDILIDLKSGHTVTLGTLADLESLFREKLGIARVDFVTRKSINPRLKQSIEKDLVTIF